MKKEKLTVLFIHNSFPGQFKNIARWLVSEGHRVFALSFFPPSEINVVPGVEVITYSLIYPPSESPSSIFLDLNTKLLRAESAAVTMQKLKEKDFYPDLIYAHPGWGEALFAKTIFPDARFVVYGEWYYNQDELKFDPEFPPASHDFLRIQAKNSIMLHALNDADAVITPTEWQKSQFPSWAQEKISVVHDGIDYAGLNMGRAKVIRLDKETLSYGSPIVTYASRFLEPLRGFHVFMRSIPIILSERPDAHIFIIGSDAGLPYTPSYGIKNPNQRTWREEYSGLISDYSSNVHFTGSLSYESFLALMKLSKCHVYLTYPFILSWSFLEVSGLGVPVIASDVPPVREFSKYLPNVTLVNFFDEKAIARNVLDILEKDVTRRPGIIESIDMRNTIPKIKSILFGEKESVRDPVKEKEQTGQKVTKKRKK